VLLEPLWRGGMKKAGLLRPAIDGRGYKL
jgi:hypothetical protein